MLTMSTFLTNLFLVKPERQNCPPIANSFHGAIVAVGIPEQRRWRRIHQ